MILLSIYDMDRTITRRATFTPFLGYAALRHRPWRLLFTPFLFASAAAYGAKTISRAELKEMNSAVLLGRRMEAGKLQKLAKGFAERTIARNVFKGALDRIAEDHCEGRRSVLATASFNFYVKEIAALLGVDDVVSTGNRMNGEDHSFGVDGENCYGDAKLVMVKLWMEQQGLKREDCHIRFYSDHVSDAPALGWADEGFATNAHGPLRKLAKQRGWQVLNWG